MDGNNDEILNAVVSLLSRLDGVSEIKTSISSTRCVIYLLIESHQSHLIAEYAALGANIRFSCWAKDSPWSEDARNNPAKSLQYSYHFLSNNESSEITQQLSLLGIFLVGSMFTLGMLTGDEKKIFTQLFGTATRNE